MKRIFLPFLFSLMMCGAALAEDFTSPDEESAFVPLPRALEIELALSALPPHLRDAATVYVQGKSREFETARRGSNGFHALVSRNDPGAFRGAWPYTAFRNDLLIPISFDDAGSRAQMKVHFDLAELRAAGKSPQETKTLINRRYETGYYKAPDRGGVSYMLSPIVHTYLDPDTSDRVGAFNVPHYMFYAPGVSNEDIGGKFISEYPYMLNRSPHPHGYIIQFVGQAEKEAINEEYSGMLERLCLLRKAYCLE